MRHRCTSAVFCLPLLYPSTGQKWAIRPRPVRREYLTRAATGNLIQKRFRGRRNAPATENDLWVQDRGLGTTAGFIDHSWRAIWRAGGARLLPLPMAPSSHGRCNEIMPSYVPSRAARSTMSSATTSNSPEVALSALPPGPHSLGR
jgi:hypothetical protein